MAREEKAFSQTRAPKVERLDVRLHVADHRLPLVADAVRHLPSVVLGVLEALAKERRLVHQLLRDAADVDAGAAEAPCRASRRWLDKVADGNLTTELRRLLRAR